MTTPVRFEIWTRPESGSFVRKFPLGFLVDYELELGMFGRGQITIPRDHPRLDDILFVDSADHSNDVGSLIRAFIGETWLTDFYASRMAINFGDLGQRVAVITGGNLAAALDRTRLRQFDWPTNPSVDPDWQYGVGRLVIGNPSFEESADFMPPLSGGKYDQLVGFEDENNAGWQSIPSGGDFEPNDSDPMVDNGDARTGTFSLQWNSGVALSGIQKPVRIAGSQRYQFTVYVKAFAGSRYIFGATNVVTTHHTNGFINSDVGIQVGWAELDNAAEGAGDSDGTWQQIDLDVTFDVFTNYADILLYVLYDDTGGGPNVRIDDLSLAGYNLGLYSWEPTSFAFVTTMERDLAPPVTARDGVAVIKIITGAAGHGIGYPIAVDPGKTYTFRSYIHHDIGVNQTFTARVVRTAGGSIIGTDSLSIATGGTWTELLVTTEVDVDAVFVQVLLEGVAATWWVDDSDIIEGLAPQTVGEIVGAIYDDAATDHSGQGRDALAWLVENYTDAADADLVNWNMDISLRLKRGSTYRGILDQIAGFGYEFDMRTDPADDSIIELSAYNPGGLGVDQTLGDDKALVNGFVALGPLVRREPLSTYMMAEGDSLQWADVRDEGLEVPWGEIEGYIGSKDNLIDNLDVQALVELQKIGLEDLRVTLQGSTLTPGIDYNIGDKVRVTPGNIPSAKYRTIGITVAGGAGSPEPLWQVSFEAETIIGPANWTHVEDTDVTTVPSGGVNGDLLAIFASADDAFEWDPLTGWSRDFTAQESLGDNRSIVVYTRTWSSEPANYTLPKSADHSTMVLLKGISGFAAAAATDHQSVGADFDSPSVGATVGALVFRWTYFEQGPAQGDHQPLAPFTATKIENPGPDASDDGSSEIFFHNALSPTGTFTWEFLGGGAPEAYAATVVFDLK